jgi:DNA mismatch repair protein MSH6
MTQDPTKPFLNLKGNKHPVLATLNSQFLQNDIQLNTDQNGDGLFIMLTGPNMGGKSTILRQSCLSIIMGQIGCYIPGDFGSWTAVDRIFTRLGANDRLISGKSTFYVEMEETSNIIKYGSNNSLAIVDELGRGTSTFDGVAIANSVMRYLAGELKCRTFFATHYHNLVYEALALRGVSFYRMDYFNDTDKATIVFLYKLLKGVCEKSFGIEVAKLTGLPKSLLDSAKIYADSFADELTLGLKIDVEREWEAMVGGLFA